MTKPAVGQKATFDQVQASALPPKADTDGYSRNVRFVATALMQSLFDQLVHEQEQFRGGESGYLAGGFKLDIGNPVALAPAQASLFILALEG